MNLPPLTRRTPFYPDAKAFTPFRGLWQMPVISSLWLYLTLCYKVRVHGRENIPPRGIPMIIAATHSSLLDPPVLSVLFGFPRPRPIAYMAKEELFQTFWGSLFCKAMTTFSVHRQKVEKGTFASAKAALASGHWAVGMFPQGTRKKDGDGEDPVGEIKKGVAFVARMNEVPVLPVAISRKGKQIDVRIGALIPAPKRSDDVDAYGEIVQQALAQLAEDIPLH